MIDARSITNHLKIMDVCVNIRHCLQKYILCSKYLKMKINFYLQNNINLC